MNQRQPGPEQPSDPHSWVIAACGLLALGLVMGGAACSASGQPTQLVAVETPQKLTPTLQPTETPSPTETPLPTPTTTIEGNYHTNLVSVVEAGTEEGSTVIAGRRLKTDLINRMIEEIAVITRRGAVDKDKVQIFLGQNLQSASLSVSAQTETGEETYDVMGSMVDVPEELTFVTNRGKEDEEIKKYSLLAERSYSEGAVYIDDDQRARVMPLRFSLLDARLPDQEIVGAVPYHVENQAGLRLAFITEDSEGRLDYLTGHHGRPFALKEMRSVLENEELISDAEGRLTIVNHQGEVILRYDDYRGEWSAEWRVATEGLELAGQEVDFRGHFEGAYRGIPYEFNLGIDFRDEVYDRLPVESIQLRNEELMGQMIMWVHYRNWATSKALESTGGINYWRSQYRTGEGQWQRSTERDMQRFIDAAKTAAERHSFEEYVSMVQAGGGHYHIFGRNEQGAYDFYQVNPRQGMTYIRRENTRTGITQSHPGHNMSHEVRISDQGELMLSFGIESTLKRDVPGRTQTILNRTDTLELRKEVGDEELEEIMAIALSSVPTTLILSGMRSCYVPPTFTVQNLRGGAYGAYPEGRVFNNNFHQVGPFPNEFNRALIPYHFRLNYDESVEVDFPLEVNLAGDF